MSFVLSVLAVGVAVFALWQTRKYSQAVELQAMRLALLQGLAREKGPVTIRTWNLFATVALDELIERGMVASTDGDSLFVLTDKGRRHLEVSGG